MSGKLKADLRGNAFLRVLSVVLLGAVLALLLWPGSEDAGEWIDLTHAFDENATYWPTADEFELEEVFAGHTGSYYYSANNYSAAEHGGTHMDAPIHFAKGRHSVEQVPLERLIGPGAVIDVSERALKNPDYQISVEDLRNWEAEHGELPDNAIVLVYTGYSRYWGDKEKYMGTAERGEAAVPLLHFPGLHPDAATWLVENRDIASIGLDTPSIDYGQSTEFKSHQILYDKQIPSFENVANLDKLPSTGTLIVALPMKIKGGSGAPLRIVVSSGARQSVAWQWASRCNSP